MIYLSLYPSYPEEVITKRVQIYHSTLSLIYLFSWKKKKLINARDYKSEGFKERPSDIETQMDADGNLLEDETPLN